MPHGHDPKPLDLQYRGSGGRRLTSALGGAEAAEVPTQLTGDHDIMPPLTSTVTGLVSADVMNVPYCKYTQVY